MSINKVICIGNLTRDAEVRTVGQNQVAKVGLAMTEKFRKQDGTIGENTEFIDIEVWGQAGVYPYLLKGQMVYVEGSFKTQKWTGQDGAQHQQTFIKAASIQLLGPRPQAQQPAAAPRAAAPAPQYPAAPPQGYAPQQQAPAPPAYPQYPPHTAAPAPVPQRPAPPTPPAPQPQGATAAAPTDDLPF